MPCGIGCTAVYFAGVFAAESAAAVGTFSAISVYNYFTTGKAGIAMWATNYKFSGWINMVVYFIIGKKK
jgi:hypothetical protein